MDLNPTRKRCLAEFRRVTRMIHAAILLRRRGRRAWLASANADARRIATEDLCDEPDDWA